jgi:hypothetical protein
MAALDNVANRSAIALVKNSNVIKASFSVGIGGQKSDAASNIASSGVSMNAKVKHGSSLKCGANQDGAGKKKRPRILLQELIPDLNNAEASDALRICAGNVDKAFDHITKRWRRSSVPSS